MFSLIDFSPLTAEQRALPNALVMFSVKDQDLFGISNQYVADCFITFREIEQANAQQQVHLKLSRPPTLGKWFLHDQNSKQSEINFLSFCVSFALTLSMQIQIVYVHSSIDRVTNRLETF